MGPFGSEAFPALHCTQYRTVTAIRRIPCQVKYIIPMNFANHRPLMVPVIHNNPMNRSRRSRILYRSLFPKSRHIVTVSTALPRAFLPDSVSLALEDPLACCTSPHESMSTCRHATMPANRLRNACNGSVAIVLPAPRMLQGRGSRAGNPDRCSKRCRYGQHDAEPCSGIPET